jgi:hypothetical protein
MVIEPSHGREVVRCGRWLEIPWRRMLLPITSFSNSNVYTRKSLAHDARASSSLMPWAVAPGGFFSHEPLFSARNVLLKLSHEVLDPLLMLQQYRHHNGLKRQWASDHDPSLNMQLGAIKEPVENGLIFFRKCSLERCPSATFICDKLPEWRKGFSHNSNLRLVQR